MINKEPFIVAEISGNHDGKLERAIDLVKAAGDCGCDAVKIQLYRSDDLNDPDNETLYRKYYVPIPWLDELYRATQIPLFASVFAPWAIVELQKYDCPAYKIASPESTRLSNDRYHALAGDIKKTGKDFIASSGASDWRMIAGLNPDYMLFCRAGYPATVGLFDLEFMSIADGFSDHTKGILSTCAMMWAGGKIIEKHFKLNDDCIDAAFSVNPKEMELLCRIANCGGK